MATAEDQINERPQLRAEPGRLSLRERWAERAKVRKLIEPVDMSKFPDEPPLYVRKLSGSEVHAWHDRHTDTKGETKNLRIRNEDLVSLCAVDEDGSRVFEVEDIASLPIDLYHHLLSESLAAIGYRKEAKPKTDEEEEAEAGK